MKHWLRGKRGGLIGFLLIAGLVLGGLGWVTATVLRLEREQRRARAEAELMDRLRPALWQLDSFLLTDLSLESGRPYSDYLPGPLGQPPRAGKNAPDWIPLHFEADDRGWRSPELARSAPAGKTQPQPPPPEDPRRAHLLAGLRDHWKAGELLALARARDALPPVLDNNPMLAQNTAPNQFLLNNQAQGEGPQQGINDYGRRSAINYNAQMRQQAYNATPSKPAAPRKSVPVQVSRRLVPVWLDRPGEPETLVLLRRVRIGRREVCQGLVIDWPRLQSLLADQVRDDLPGARFVPVRSTNPPHPERTLTALPIELVPGPAVLPPAGWTPLRVGLGIAWAAVLVALLAVALGGWSLLDLSERRSRFVSAVTHELRTPLTTLRLYLDMLTSGLVHEEKQKEEYLHTLHGEADRLNRLIGNVLDFARLERQRPRLEKQPVRVADLLEQLRAAWQTRCQDTGKELVLENAAGAEAVLVTDGRLVQQILGNLIDNACKYSRGAADPHIWFRARREGRKLVLEVEDRGPGVTPRERRAVFHPFRRGREADVTAGGVGLGLALARRWATLLGGKLTLGPPADQSGACFRLELPV